MEDKSMEGAGMRVFLALIVLFLGFGVSQADLYPHYVGGVYGYIDSTASVIVKPKYTLAMDFSSGVGVAQYKDKDGQVLFCCINSDGDEFYTTRSFISQFSEGMAATKNIEGKWGYIDQSGKNVIPNIYEKALSFRGGRAVVGFETTNGVKWNYLDDSGEHLLTKYVDKAFSFHEGFAIVRNQDDVRLINNSGQNVYSTGENIVFYSGGVLCVNNDGLNVYFRMSVDDGSPAEVKFLFFDKRKVKGRLFSDGIFLVSDIQGRYYHLNDRGKEIDRGGYEYAGAMIGGYADFIEDGLYGVVGVDGSVVVPPIYRYLEFTDDRKFIRFTGVSGDGLAFGYMDINQDIMWESSAKVKDEVPLIFREPLSLP